MIQPIDNMQRMQVTRATNERIKEAQFLFGRNLDPVEVVFDLKGKCAGMYRVRNRERQIRYNPWLFAGYFMDNVENTVPHEVAHYVADMLFGTANIKPHGAEWKNIMIAFGVDPVRTCNYDITGMPVRQYRTFSYRCACSNHELKSRRHNQVILKRRQYICRQCGQLLVSSSAAT